MKQILKYLSAKDFFPDYAADIKNFRHKMRGADGNGKPIEFTPDEKKLILSGLNEMVRDISDKLKT